MTPTAPKRKQCKISSAQYVPLLVIRISYLPQLQPGYLCNARLNMWIYLSDSFAIDSLFSQSNSHFSDKIAFIKVLLTWNSKFAISGGLSFFEAYQMACPMRRKRTTTNLGETKYRKATLKELMEICCIRGCDIADLSGYCGPFNS